MKFSFKELAKLSDDAAFMGGIKLNNDYGKAFWIDPEFLKRIKELEQWKKNASSQAVEVHSQYKKDYPHAFVAYKGMKRKKLWASKLIGKSTSQRASMIVKPLRGINGATASEARAEVWRKRGGGGTKNISHKPVPCWGPFVVPAGRSCRIGNFSTFCVVMYNRADYDILTNGVEEGEASKCLP